MNKELKDKWLAALRSGEYQQTRYTLREKNEVTDKFCCLGVLCELIDKDKWNDPAPGRTHLGWDNIIATVIPDSISKELGYIKDHYAVASVLAGMNDREGKSFQEIADYIEENIPADGE